VPCFVDPLYYSFSLCFINACPDLYKELTNLACYCMSIVLSLYGINPLGIWCSLALKFLCSDDLSTYKSGVLKSPTTLVSEPICHFISSSVCFMKLGPPTFDEYKFVNIISSLWIVSFFISSLLDMSIATSVCFQFQMGGYIIFHAFTFNLCVSLPMSVSLPENK
jgi:hypothetical protein